MDAWVTQPTPEPVPKWTYRHQRAHNTYSVTSYHQLLLLVLPPQLACVHDC
jgi:hypothetical protein